MGKGFYKSPSARRYKAKRRYVRRYKRRTPVMRKKSKVYDSMNSKFDVVKPMIHEAALGYAGMVIRWTDTANPGGNPVSRMINVSDCSEFAVVTANFQRYKITFC